MVDILIASDHKGFQLKNSIKKHLEKKGISVKDMGPTRIDKDDDYPDYAKKVCKKIGTDSFGILICGSGIGMSIAANKHKGIRAALVTEPIIAKKSRMHNDANVLCMAGQYTTTAKAQKIVDAFLFTRFSGDDRHKRRIRKVNNIQK